MTRRALAVWPYAAAAVALPVLSYRLQPRFCLEHLLLPYLLPALVLLCLVCAAAQSFVAWRPMRQCAVGVVFAVSIQSLVLVPCVASLDESPRTLQLLALTWHLGWLAGASLALTSVGLYRSRLSRRATAVAATGFALAAGHFVLGAAKQHLVGIGAF